MARQVQKLRNQQRYENKLLAKQIELEKEELEEYQVSKYRRNQKPIRLHDAK